MINDVWLIKANINETQRDDLLVIQSNVAVTVVVLNRSAMAKLNLTEPIRSVVFINNILMIATQSKKVLGYEYNYSTCQFK
jgi:hypothetical protein